MPFIADRGRTVLIEGLIFPVEAAAGAFFCHLAIYLLLVGSPPLVLGSLTALHPACLCPLPTHGTLLGPLPGPGDLSLLLCEQESSGCLRPHTLCSAVGKEQPQCYMSRYQNNRVRG